MASRERLAAAGLGRVLTTEAVSQVAADVGVCVRPVVRRVTDRQTGAVEQVTLPCGSTRESVCGPCAAKARRLRMQQCAEGWHLEEDPLEDDQPDSDADGDDDDRDDGDPRAHLGGCGRPVAVRTPPTCPGCRSRTAAWAERSPPGRDDVPTVDVRHPHPRLLRPDRAGHRHPDAAERYDYRRAAVEAMHFPKLVDRWMQNLRRCAGYQVQYFGAIEPQRRLAPHLHLAIRGAIPRRVIRTVTRRRTTRCGGRHSTSGCTRTRRRAGVEPDHRARRGQRRGRVADVGGGARRARRRPDAEPAVVVRFGSQVDIKGIIAPSQDADRASGT